MTIVCSALLFDLDGVLVDSQECITRAWQRWADAHGLDLQAILAVAPGRRTIDVVRLVAPHLAADDEVAALVDIEAHDTEGIHQVPGAQALLRSLPPSTWAVITAGVRAVATLRLRHTQLPDPRILITAEDLNYGKPNPEGYLMASARLQVPASECIVVEDAPAGVEAALAAGMRVIAVTTTHFPQQLAAASWGLSSLRRLRVTALAGGLQLDFEEPLWFPDHVAD